METGENINTQEKVLYDEWLEAFIYYRSEEGPDDFDVQFIKEQMGLDIFYDSEKEDLKVNEFLIKTDELLSQNFTQEEIEEELKDYIDFLNTQGPKEIERLTKEYEEEERLRKKLSNNYFNGKKLEKEGKIDEAIELYEENIKLNDTAESSYWRLAVIYRKRRDYPNEIRVCEKYIKIAKDKIFYNDVEKFEKRLEKAKKLKETYYYLFTD